MKYLIGIDIGTSSTKTVLFDKDGVEVCSSTGHYSLIQPLAGWAEQNPLDWWNAVKNTIKDVIIKSKINNKDIQGIGLSGQMHGLVMLDSDNNVLRNAIIWCDQRTSPECDDITAKIGRQKLIEITANPALTGFTASKILWVRKNEPDVYKKCKKILLPKDYIRFMLTGEYATEVSDASGMQLLNVSKRKWSDELLDKLEINKSLLGKVYESQEITGYVTEKAAEETGLYKGTAVVGGAGDQAAAGIGNGIVREGLISDTIGTSGVVFACTNKPCIDNFGRVQTFCHAIPNKWHVMGVTQSATLSFNWFKTNFEDEFIKQCERDNKNSYEELFENVGKTNAGSNGIIFLPYLMGERTPHLDANAKGVFFGITAKTTKNDMLRAVIEGVCFSQLDCLNIIEDLTGKIKEVKVGGGGSKRPQWCQILADCFNKKVILNDSETGALGVAILAAVGTGLYPTVENACDVIIKNSNIIYNPDTELHSTYMSIYKKYRNIYKSLKEVF